MEILFTVIDHHRCTVQFSSVEMYMSLLQMPNIRSIAIVPILVRGGEPNALYFLFGYIDEGRLSLSFVI